MLERRSKSMIMSTLLYVLSTVFLCYLAFSNVSGTVWNGLLWIIILFAITNASSRIFFHESGQQRIYLYTLANAKSIILSKILYQWMLSGAISIVVLLLWMTLFSFKINQFFWFTLVLLLGVWAMSNVLTLNNAISSGTKNSPTVLAILSFPVILPILLTTIKASEMALLNQYNSGIVPLLLVLLLLNILTVTLSIILFQYLWRY
jgi:heme exporter protein B